MRLLFLIFLTLCAGIAGAETVNGTATVVDVQGNVEARAGNQAWGQVRARQQLTPGQELRTGARARVALLLSDRTQIRLNENTLVQIVAMQPEPRSPGQTKFRQMRGQAWVQSKTPPKDLQWETPTAIAGLRGTDWEMSVTEDGVSTLSVFSGVITLANDQGRIDVGANEQARVVAGGAPVKITVNNLKDRIQWVTAYRLEPLRQISLLGDDMASTRQILADSQGGDAASLARRGRAQLDLGDWRAAQESLQTALKLDPTRQDARIGMVYASLWRGAKDAASDWLARSRPETPDAEWRLADAVVKLADGDLDSGRAALSGLDETPDAWLLRADIDVYEGQTRVALDTLRAGLRRFPADPRLLAALARAQVRVDDLPAARASADQALDANLATYEAWLAQAEIARLEGNATTAIGAYDTAVSLKPADDRAWFGRGDTQTERDYLDAARADLDQALALNPDGLGYLGQRATLATLMDDYPAAEETYRRALAANPADYVALTGLGVLQLKRGETEKALENLLKAGVMEPRYARVHVYTAAAYYQLGDVAQAQHELKRASELDDKDPLPYFMAAQIDSDRLRPGDAIDNARAALERMPYLKSLDQLANDQKGSANLGQSFAFMGMEDWAASYAQESYTPYWAGSHLFLADRYIGLFTKNSELFQGLLSDPTVFGAGNRFKPLIAGPANHGGVSLRYSHSDDIDGWSPQVELSGYRAEPKPMAYYLGYEKVDWDRFDRPYDLDNLTAAFGVKPRHDLGMFLFADATRQDSQPTGTWAGLDYDLDDRLDTRRVDLGVNYKLRPDDQVWLKAGYFHSKEKFTGDLGFDTVSAASNIEVPEFSARHVFDHPSGQRIAWGFDTGRRMIDASLDDGVFLRQDYRVAESSLDVYVSDTYSPTPKLDLQGDLVWQRQRRKATEQPYIIALDPPEPGSVTTETANQRQFSPRLGLVYRADGNLRLRLAYQDWLRPTNYSALQPVATAGIALDDRLVVRGGELERLRAQGEWEATPSTFVMGYADFKRIDNHLMTIRPPSVSDLEGLGKLRPRDFGALMRDDLYEVADTPDYAGGDIASLGVSLNHRLNRNWALNARYVWTDSENSQDDSLDIPYLPRHAVSLGATWIDERGWYVAGRLAWRAKRYEDEANSLRLDSGWAGDLDVFRESRDKRWLLRFSANNLFGDAPEQLTAEINYRF
jgi:tetratricopeptide (TPR) repeat protein